MGFSDKIRKSLGLVGLPDDHIQERTTGCWNCVAEGSMVLGPNGAIPIEQAALLTQISSSTGFETASNWVASGQKEVVEITTSYGSRLRVTPDHKIFTDRGWVAACDLKPASKRASGAYIDGDHVVGQPEIEGRAKTMNLREAELIGIIVGDGWIKGSTTGRSLGVGFGFTGERSEAFAALMAYAGERFESKERPRNKPGSNDFRQVEWRSHAAREWGKLLDKNHVPKEIWGATPEIVGAYTRGLFSTDGSIGERSAHFYQTSKALVYELQILLRTIGIVGRVSMEQRAPYKDLYRLSVSRLESLTRFRDVAGFLDERRQLSLEAIIKNGKRRESPERIASVVSAGTAQTFDVSVPATESFFANSILVHNCKHIDFELAKKRWWESGREALLTRAVKLSMSSPAGENDPKVLAIRKDVPAIDVGIEQRVWGWCDKGEDANGNPTNFVHTAYMCPKYTMAAGASVARAGAKMDELPADIMSDLQSDIVKNN